MGRLDLRRSVGVLLLILVLTAALVLTNSRGGFLSTLAGAAVLLLCLNYRRRIRSRGVHSDPFWQQQGR